METITSKDNPLVKRLRALATDPGAYRKLGQVWLEGDHLVRALWQRGGVADVLVFSETGWGSAALHARLGALPAGRCVVVPDQLMAQASGLEQAAPVGCLWAPPAGGVAQPGVATVVLDRLQDPGNVGSVVRSAAAMGFGQVVALRGTAALWSPKVVRAGMGAHFALNLVEGVDPGAIASLGVPVLATSSHGGEWLHQARLPWPCAWLMGHEGQGVSDALMALANQRIRIVQPGGEESLNVAAAAAICLHASASTRTPAGL